MNKLLSLLVSFALLFTQLAPLGYAKGSRHHHSSTPRASTSALSKNDIALVEKMLGDSENEVNWGNAQNVNTLIKAIGKDRSIKSRYANNLENGFNTANAACHHQVEAERSGAWPAICPAVKSLAKTLNIKRSVRTKFFCNTRKEWLDKADEYKCFKEGEIYGGELDEVVVIGIAKNPIKETLDILEGPEGDQDGGGQGGGNGNGNENGQGQGGDKNKPKDNSNNSSTPPEQQDDFVYLNLKNADSDYGTDSWGSQSPELRKYMQQLNEALKTRADLTGAVNEILTTFYQGNSDLPVNFLSTLFMAYADILADNPQTGFGKLFRYVQYSYNGNVSGKDMKDQIVRTVAMRALESQPAFRAMLTDGQKKVIQSAKQVDFAGDPTSWGKEKYLMLAQEGIRAKGGKEVVTRELQQKLTAAGIGGQSNLSPAMQVLANTIVMDLMAELAYAGSVQLGVEIPGTVLVHEINLFFAEGVKTLIVKTAAELSALGSLTAEALAAAAPALVVTAVLGGFIFALNDAYAESYKPRSKEKANAIMHNAIVRSEMSRPLSTPPSVTRQVAPPPAINRHQVRNPSNDGMAGRINQAGQTARDQYVSTGTVEYQYPRAQEPALPNTQVGQPGVAVASVESDNNWAEPTSLKKAVGFTLTAALAANMGQKELTCVYTGEKLESAEADKFTVEHLNRYLKPEDEATKRLFLCVCPGKPFPSDGKNLFSEAVCGRANVKRTVGSIPDTCMQSSLKTALRYRYSFVSSYDRRQLPFHAVYHMGRWYPEAEIPIDGENIPKTLYGVFKQFMKDKTEEMIDAVVGAAFRFDAGGGISQNMYPGVNSPHDKWLRVGPDEVKKNKNGQCHIHYEEMKTERGLTYVCNHSLYFDMTGGQKSYLNTIKNLLGIGIE